MKAVILLLVAVILMSWLGWLTFQKTNGQATVTLETEQIQKDTERAVEKGKDVGGRLREKKDEVLK